MEAAEMQQRMTEREMQGRAIQRALANGGARAVTRYAYGRYYVHSATREGLVHAVSQDASGRLHCTCEAALAGRPCWHAAAVFIAKTEAGGGRVTGPTTKERAREVAPAQAA